MAAVILSLMLFSSGAGAAPFKKPCHWRYIVIHHSATRKGNAAIMDRYHSNRRHMQNGLAYHFVIGNGTSGCADGEVEESYRWRAQLPGGHSKQPWLNESGIGICLVGNFNRQTVSSKQMSSLVKLVNELCTTYNIPLSCIKGHGDFKGEHTMCPGYNFPMRRFKECLKKGNMPVSTKWSVANRKSNASMPAVSINERQNPYPVISERALPAKKRPVS